MNAQKPDISSRGMRLAGNNKPWAGGFTLVELMVVVAIVAILALIAYPGYQQFVRGARQSDTQGFMLSVSSRAEQFRMDLRDYPTGLGADAGELDMDVPSEVSDYYTIALTRDDGPPQTYTITATPKAGTMQENEATLTLTSTGNKTPAEEWQ
jgi:type IV pilus assembly protein PilE